MDVKRITPHFLTYLPLHREEAIYKVKTGLLEMVIDSWKVYRRSLAELKRLSDYSYKVNQEKALEEKRSRENRSYRLDELSIPHSSLWTPV